ncbi:AAA family ATPase [Nocardia cyriacigeorgica]|uniref:AAA family ATPase n=1 Tax=Nocardia cyriacigeorgica TaxID=135487 RepID=A0A6P1CJH3_9NOCA|nr:bifunctional aminoglycoside phosphotransferase/ATP-binding protein [Nocardia cyriacigeorgica]NEW32751.1 AAA family ATPase [Nocardia cyriacigeorgica]PPJ03598.1 hypothetical protein C5E43_24720 [Nocardia cyriacigeorgica]
MNASGTAAAAGAQLHETHTGLVVLCGDRANKVKKPISTDFLDFSTPQRREEACARELELNRRMAPDVYLGVGHLTDPTGGPAEPVLIMRRMPEKLRLSTLLAEWGPECIDLNSLVDTLVRFHRAARRGPEIDRAGRTESVRERWLAVLDTLRHQSSDLIDPRALAKVEAQTMRYLAGRTLLFDQRIAAARIVDGHGDLLAQDIFALPDGFRILDCLDFDDALRYLDCVDDIAFLAMDLEFLGHRDLAERLLTDYLRATADTAPRSLLDHYIAYRALVRAKVDVIRFAQGEEAARGRARRHVALAEDHSGRAVIRLVLIGGLPGTGKSTVAQALAEETGAIRLSSDLIRRELTDRGALSGSAGTYGHGRYSAAGKAMVYDEMLTKAKRLLELGESVVLDASWIDAEQRDRARSLAAEVSAELVQIRCWCPSDLARQRIRHRGGDSASEVTVDVAMSMAADDVPRPDAHTVSTDQPLANTMAAVREVWHTAATTSGHDATPTDVVHPMG